MPRGGFRPGSGLHKVVREPKVAKDIRCAAKSAGMTPLEYMLAVINDETAEEVRRDRMAIAAAPFIHPKADAAVGKKEAANIHAQTAHEESAWGDLVN